MQFTTTRFGVVEVPEDTVYRLPDGLPGFPGPRRFAILSGERYEPFRWLQSLDDPSLAFLVLDPLLFRPDYRIEVAPDDIRPIRMENLEAGFVLVIVTLPADPRQMTANLRAPLVFNPDQQLARQLILTRSEHPVRYRVFSGSESDAVASGTAQA